MCAVLVSIVCNLLLIFVAGHRWLVSIVSAAPENILWGIGMFDMYSTAGLIGWVSLMSFKKFL